MTTPTELPVCGLCSSKPLYSTSKRYVSCGNNKCEMGKMGILVADWIKLMGAPTPAAVEPAHAHDCAVAVNGRHDCSCGKAASIDAIHALLATLPNASALPRDERTQPIQPTTPTPGSSAAAPGSELDHKE